MKIIKYCFLLLTLFTFFSCNPIREQYSDGGANDVSKEMSEQEAASMPTVRLDPIEKMVTKYLAVDLNEDGQMDSLYLAVSAEMDDQENIIYDDANIWSAYAIINGKRTKLYQESIQLGKVKLSYQSDDNIIYLIEDGPYQKRKFKIDPEDLDTVDEVKAVPSVGKELSLEFE